jgi:hypothetical protein
MPYQDIRLLINFVVFTGVAICMTDVFVRVMRALEPERQGLFAYLWLGLVGVIPLGVATMETVAVIKTFAGEPAPETAKELGSAAPRGMFDLVLRDPARLDALLLDEGQLGAALHKLLGLSLLGLAAHGLLLGFVQRTILWNSLSVETQMFLGNHPACTMPVAFVCAFLTALGVCLPTFYFFTQLSGLDASFRLVTAQAVRVMARTAVLLLGALPFYAALSLSRAVSSVVSPYTVLAVGFGLPFFIGLFGIASLYCSFRSLVKVLPITHERRGRFLLRMVLAWGAVYSAVAPVALFRCVEALGRTF